MTLTSRAYRGPEDTPRIRNFLVSARAGSGPADYWHVGDLAWRLFLLSARGDPARSIQIWENDGALVGHAWFQPGDPLAVQVHPTQREQGVQAEMLDWAEQHARSTPPDDEDEAPSYLAASAHEDDAYLIDLLLRRGFRREERWHGVHLLRSLTGPIAAPRLPEGFAVRCLAGEQEAELCAQAHNDASESTFWSRERYLQLMRLPDFTADLDLAAFAPDGTIAAYGLGWFDAHNKVGEFEPVATRPAFRRMGLAQAVLTEGLRRMQALGAETAIVETLSDEVPAVRLYESIGFGITKRTFDYVKPL